MDDIQNGYQRTKYFVDPEKGKYGHQSMHARSKSEAVH